MASTLLPLVDPGVVPAPGTPVPSGAPPVRPPTGPRGRPRRRGPDGVSRRVRRNRFIAGLVVVGLVGLGFWLTSGGGAPVAVHPVHHRHLAPAGPVDARLTSDWEGDGKPVTFAFGGDVNFPSGSVLGSRLSADPAPA